MSETVAFNTPHGIFVSNGEVFICDANNHRVRKLLRNGQCVTIAGTGTAGYANISKRNGHNQWATRVHLNIPSDVFVSSLDQVYISEFANCTVRKICPNGIMKTIAGTGLEGYNGDNQLATSAMLKCPMGLFVDDEEEVFVCDSCNNRIRKVDKNGMITTIVGNGKEGYNGDDQLATSAMLNFPTGITIYRNEIYFCDTNNHRIRKVDQNGIITTIAGTGVSGFNGDDQLATSAMLNAPFSLVVQKDGLIFTDWYNHRVRKVLPNGMITTIAGEDNSTENGLYYPKGIAVEGSTIYVSDNLHRICKIETNGKVTRIAGTGEKKYSGDVPFSIKKYPHRGRRVTIKPFPKAFQDITFNFNN